MFCSWHLCKNKLSGKSTKFCSLKCKNKSAVSNRRKKLKEMSVEYLGGSCKRCGYNKCLAALDFHHLSNKSFGIGTKGYTRAWAKVKEELNKCILLCRNCHNELHTGLWSC